jgi:hypothetical protein
MKTVAGYAPRNTHRTIQIDLIHKTFSRLLPIEKIFFTFAPAVDFNDSRFFNN